MRKQNRDMEFNFVLDILNVNIKTVDFMVLEKILTFFSSLK